MGRTSKTRLYKISMNRMLNQQKNSSKACLLLTLLVVMHHWIPITYCMLDRKSTTKHKILMLSSKIPWLLRLYWAIRWHLRSAPCMMCLLSIKLHSSTTSSLFKVLMIKVPHIALCFQARLMGLTRKEMHLFQAWKTLTPLIELFLAYKRLPPIQCLHPNYSNCWSHWQMCFKNWCVSSLPCI